MKQQMIDQIIGASMVDGRENVVFCLGPFSRRVSFIAQQNRALNLVWALRERRHFTAGDQVAVIGGGVAGLTAAAGLIAYGCAVDIFESSENTVANQRHTEHRLVHPTINQWPSKNLSLTTELPFLEWFAGTCSEVTKSIAGQFEDLLGTNRLLTEHEVLDISDIAAGLVGLKVKPRLEDPRPYKLVLIAIGFGDERKCEPFPQISYWFPDSIEILRDRKKVQEFLISGCGDGGLIDALRILHRGFEKGALAFDVAQALSDTDIARAIANAESAARLANDPSNLSDVYQQAAQELDTSPLYADVAKLLRKSLTKASLIYLIDRDHDQPYSLNAAPIHKLLIAHAWLRNLISYRKGVAEKTGKIVQFAGKHIPAPPDSLVVIRHGPEFNFGRLLSTDEIQRLKARQEALSDFCADALWPEPYPTPLSIPLRDLTNQDFIESRLPLATRAIRSVSEDSDIMPLAGRLRAIYGGKIPENAPLHLFGIPVESHSRPKVRGIGA